jgi:hypothetical protein
VRQRSAVPSDCLCLLLLLLLLLCPLLLLLLLLLQEWKKDLASVNPKAADALADPEDYPNLFPGLQVRLQAYVSKAQWQLLVCCPCLFNILAISPLSNRRRSCAAIGAAAAHITSFWFVGDLARWSFSLIHWLALHLLLLRIAGGLWSWRRLLLLLHTPQAMCFGGASALCHSFVLAAAVSLTAVHRRRLWIWRLLLLLLRLQHRVSLAVPLRYLQLLGC